jgi:hypothetical protein
VKASVGFYGFYAGPDVHVVDILGLGDPLLARLPVLDPNWQVGHFGRRPPAGYLETLETGQNRLDDASLSVYYDHLALIVAGDLLAPGRLQAIWKLNTGAYDPLLDGYLYDRGLEFVQDLEITNPTTRPYAYAYVWNSGTSALYLLDDDSTQGKRYQVRWELGASGARFQGRYVDRLSSLEAISDGDLLNVGVFFAEDAGLMPYVMFERRYWFTVDQDGALAVLLPALEWVNEAGPGGYWYEQEIDPVVRVLR